MFRAIGGSPFECIGNCGWRADLINRADDVVVTYLTIFNLPQDILRDFATFLLQGLNRARRVRR